MNCRALDEVKRKKKPKEQNKIGRYLFIIHAEQIVERALFFSPVWLYFFLILHVHTVCVYGTNERR